LLVNDTVIAAFLPQEDGEFVMTAELTNTLPDNFDLILVGTTGRRESSSVVSAGLTAFDPLTLESLTVVPDELMRFVVQPLLISWDVENAALVRVQLTGLEAYTRPEGTVDLPATGSLDEIIDIPLQDIVISVYAEGESGNNITDEIIVPALLPQCSPADEPVRLFSGPNSMNQEIGTVPESASVIVDGRDVTGAWIRVRENGGWGALAAFDCASNFNPAELRQIIEVIPPPQQPTQPLPTITPTAPLGVVPTQPSVTNITPGAVITSTPVPAIDATPQPTSAG
jgi:hypothetical protein